MLRRKMTVAIAILHSKPRHVPGQVYAEHLRTIYLKSLEKDSCGKVQSKETKECDNGAETSAYFDLSKQVGDETRKCLPDLHQNNRLMTGIQIDEEETDTIPPSSPIKKEISCLSNFSNNSSLGHGLASSSTLQNCHYDDNVDEDAETFPASGFQNFERFDMETDCHSDKMEAEPRTNRFLQKHPSLMSHGKVCMQYVHT